MFRMMVPLLAAAALVAQAAPALAADAAAGKRVFAQCRACHTAEKDGPNRIGPHLWGVVGRKAGSVEGFRYSESMKKVAEEGLVWTPDKLDNYIKNPKELVPRGSMAFAGVKNDTQRANLIAYLETLK